MEKLKENGFVVIPNPYNPREEDITAMYDRLENEGQQIFITSIRFSTSITFSLTRV